MVSFIFVGVIFIGLLHFAQVTAQNEKYQVIGKDPKTNDNVKSNYSALNFSTTSTVNESTTSSNTSTTDVIANSTKDISLANQSYVTDTDNTSSYTYVIPVVFIIIAVSVISIIFYFWKCRKRTDSNGQESEHARPFVDTSITFDTSTTSSV